jgi:hypothetical protein
MPQAAAKENREGEVWHPVVVVITVAAVRAPAGAVPGEREQVVMHEPFPPAVPVMDESALREPEPRSRVVVVRWLRSGHQTAVVAAAEPPLSADWNSLATVNWSAAQANCLPSPTGSRRAKTSGAGYPRRCSAAVDWFAASADWLATPTGSRRAEASDAGCPPVHCRVAIAKSNPPGTTCLRAR